MHISIKTRKWVQVVVLTTFFSLAVIIPKLYAQPHEFAGGSGTAEDPYQLETIEQMQAVQQYLQSHFILIADIDAAEAAEWDGGKGFEPIGYFQGSLDGDGHKISNLTIKRGGTGFIGLFAIIAESAEVKNLTLENAFVQGQNAIGVLAGFNMGIIDSCHVQDAQIAGLDAVGGLVGMNENQIQESSVKAVVTGEEQSVGGLAGVNMGLISQSQAQGQVSGQESIGGLVGYNDGANILKSHAQGQVSGQESIGGLVGRNNASRVDQSQARVQVQGGNYVGGLAGSSVGHSNLRESYALGQVEGDDSVGGLLGGGTYTSISNCFSKGKVTGVWRTGGLTGYLNRSSLDKSYATGSVNGVNNVGGLAGEISYYSRVSESYATGEVQGNYNVGGLVGESREDSSVVTSYWDMQSTRQDSSNGGQGRDTAQMKLESTYIGWDFENTWWIKESVTYPRLLAVDEPRQTGFLPSVYLLLLGD